MSFEDEIEDIDDMDDEDEALLSSAVPESSGGGDEAGWLTSYADLMTLVACFFILMMAFANYDPPTFQRKAELMAKYFQGENDTSESKMKKLMVELNSISNIQKNLKIEYTDDGLQIVMNVKTLFALGSARLSADSGALIDTVIEVIKNNNSKGRIVVEGHTDNIPIVGHRQFASNWELSGARAGTVIRRFEAAGFDRNNLVAVGFADTRPAFPNQDTSGKTIKENQLRNRRIVLRVMHEVGKSVPMGFGVLFNKKTNAVDTASNTKQ